MSDSGTMSAEDGGRLAAAEYVLGVVGARERRQAEQRMVHDQGFANEIAFWEERLGPLAEAVVPATPSATVWKRITRTIDGRHRGGARESFWQSLVFWRNFALGSALLAAASIGALTFIEISPPPARTPMLATLGASNGQPDFVAAVNATGTAMLVVPASLLTADQRAMELWLIPAGDKPHSLGLIDPGRPVRVNVPPELTAQVNGNAVLAVSLEPAGGSPTGQPTGPVIANGKLTSL